MLILASALGTVVVAEKMTMRSGDIIRETETTVSTADVSQLATALELYYGIHLHYPLVNGGEGLVDELVKEQYIINRPPDASIFSYEALNNGQLYSLSVK